MENQIDRKKYGYLEGWVTTAINILIFAVRLVFGIMINSIAVIADSVHSLGDALTSIIVIVSFKISSRPADERHPFGHGRCEFIGTLIIAILLIVVGIELFKNAFLRVINPPEVKGNLLAFWVIAATIIFKEAIAQWAFYLGRKIDSDILYADAWHSRSDALISIPVAVGVLLSHFGFSPRIDAVLGAAVSLAIVLVGILLVYKSSSSLLGEAPKAELQKNIEKLAQGTPGVKGVHDIWIHNYGDKNSISLHIEVDKNLSLNEAHKLADEVENKIFSDTKSSTVVHVDVISKGKISR
jgi:cation diffusion facilitator family transporter